MPIGKKFVKIILMTKVPKEIEKSKEKKVHNWAGIIYTLLSAIIIILGTFIAIRWAKGDFRLDESSQVLSRETGLLHATSTPQGAQVYINDILTSATDNIIYLAPGEYNIRIQKDGYSPWVKKIKIEKSLVSAANAILFPYSPSLTSLTFTGVKNISVSPNKQKLIFYTDNISAKNKNGLYLLDLSNSSKSPTQITDNDQEFSLEEAKFIWSPDSNQVLVFSPERTFLLNVHSYTALQSSPSVAFQLSNILFGWEEEILAKEKQYLEKIPKIALQTILNQGVDFYLSNDNQKLLYTATGSAVLAENLIAPLPASNNYPEKRIFSPGEVYVYDSYEDKNFLLDQESSQSGKHLLTAVQNLTPMITKPVLGKSLQVKNNQNQTIENFNHYYGDYRTKGWQWLPNSTHLVKIKEDKVVITSYDSTNPTVIYSGDLKDNFVLPYPDGNKVLILTSFTPDSPANIYAIELKK